MPALWKLLWKGPDHTLRSSSVPLLTHVNWDSVCTATRGHYEVSAEQVPHHRHRPATTVTAQPMGLESSGCLLSTRHSMTPLVKGETEQPASVRPEALGGCQPVGTGLPTTQKPLFWTPHAVDAL